MPPMSDGTRIHYRNCPLCEATCGLAIKLEGDRIASIRGDDDDAFSRGFICPKGATLKHLHEDPDRLRAPMIRRGNDPESSTWESVTWDAAFAEIEQRLMPIRERHGRHAVAVYLGNPNVHHLAGPLYVRPLVRALGTRNVFSASTVDQMPKHVSSGLLFGDPLAIPVPDLDRCDFLLMLGANPWESNGSLCTAPDFPGRLTALRARGGRFVVVDPRLTRTAEHADEHVPIRPGGDAHLLLSMIHVVFAEELAALGRLEAHSSGVDGVRALVQPFSPERVERVSGVPAETVRRLTRELSRTPRAAVYGRIGTHTVAFGTIGAWAVDVLNALTGHLDCEGGAMWALPAHSRRGTGKPGRGFRIGRHKSRVKGYPEVKGELPVATLADEIETPGDEQVRALLTIGGNPVLSTPQSTRLDRVLRQLDFMVSVDPYCNETTRHAQVILPPPPALARSHYDLAFYALSVRNVAKWSPPALAHDGLDEAEILAKLTMIASGQGAAADTALIHRMLEAALLDRGTAGNAALQGKNHDELLNALVAETPSDRAVEIMIRTGAYGDQFGENPGGLDFDTLRKHPHGIDLGPLEPRIPELLETPSGTIELCPELIASDLPRLLAALDEDIDGELRLIGRRDLRSNNSWMHNIGVLVRGKDRCTLEVHPSDAARAGLSDGALARIRSRAGELVVKVQVTDRIMPGVVSLPHGWGHGLGGTKLRVAAEHAGVNANVLTDGESIDPLSGNAVLNGVRVSVLRA
jgi:anaerobic selenocysteine-containing dehydrogenase